MFSLNLTGNLVMIGYGGVARCLLPMLVRDFALDPARVIVIDAIDHTSELREFMSRGTRFIQQRITRNNLEIILNHNVKSGDMLVDLSVNVDSGQFVDWCQAHSVLYINASVEEWDPYTNAAERTPQERTLYARHLELRKQTQRNNGSTALLDHGVNPGLVSHFVKAALVDIAEHTLTNNDNEHENGLISTALKTGNWAKLSELLGVKVIHISERDSQSVNLSKRPNEFVNTWSVDGLIEESIAPAEMGWGTHERELPPLAYEHEQGPRNQICLARPGFKTLVRSWVPSGEIIGMVIRHGEAFTISEYLTVKANGKLKYRPTVHYAYCCNDEAHASLHELEMRKYRPQEHQRIIADEILDGKDELGVLLMGHKLGAWWFGSVLDIHNARLLVPGQSATTVQVAAGVAAGIWWVLLHPDQGMVVPDDLPWHQVLEIARPYLGKIVSTQVDWSPAQDRKDLELYSEWNGHKAEITTEDMWQFKSFLVD